MFVSAFELFSVPHIEILITDVMTAKEVIM